MTPAPAPAVTAPATDALAAAAELCWGPPARAEVVRGRPLGRRPRPGAGERVLAEFLLVPSAARPRLLVPAGSPRAAAASIRRFSLAVGGRERAVRSAIAAVVGTGLLDAVLPDRLRVGVPAALADTVPALTDRLEELLGGPVVLSLGVGTPRANRKPVLQVLSPVGRTMAFVKLGDTEVTRPLLRAEASALRRLAEAPPAHLEVPALLLEARFGTVDVLVQSALATPLRPGGPADRPPLAAMRSLADTFGAGTVPLGDSPLWRRLEADVPQIADGPRREAFAAVLAASVEQVGHVDLPCGAWHGDWTPWNMAHGPRGPRVWDWERFDEGVPRGFDVLHYAGAVEGARLPWPQVLDRLGALAPDLLAPAGVPAAGTTAVLRAYLVELCRRYLLAAQPAAGVPLRERSDQLLEHLVRAGGVRTDPLLPDWSTT